MSPVDYCSKHDPELSPRGFQQARLLAERLRNSNIKHIFSSPYIRCLQTANEVANVLDLPIKVEDGIREWFGEGVELQPKHEPQPLSEVRRFFPRIDMSYQSRLRVTTGETEIQLYFRMMKIMSRLCNEFVFGRKLFHYDDETGGVSLVSSSNSSELGNILIVTHAAGMIAAGRALLALTDPRPKNEEYFLRADAGRRWIPNCGVCSLTKLSIKYFEDRNRSNDCLSFYNECSDVPSLMNEWNIELDGDISHLMDLKCITYWNFCMPLDLPRKPESFYC
jgi:broad specificity phosphatase PhoE